MYYRLDEPEVDVKPAVYEVKARLEGQRAVLYVKPGMGVNWGVYPSRDSTTAIKYYSRLEEAIDQARERCARDVKILVLNAEAQRIHVEGQ